MGDPERDHSRAIEDHGGVVVGGRGPGRKERHRKERRGDKWKRKAKTRNMITSLPTTGEKEDWGLPGLSVTCPI